ncbi:CHY zinc finger protein [Aquisalibacillus elongatus]|uniref:Putative CHY-type Zn-finger protein n=1 Tax=Aquisalibacillus elongatus TaxID=485577 RepID=A0A3N5BUE0_9BACI|nr:CHY zinc finger protein [Aquisalibacillus elongatus]RPF53388.1 putative CHY-type Zn-finger protein [Aquisalibacillus elongatus]
MTIKGKIIDEETRCEHYHSAQDVIAIKFRCCGEYYPCYQCHQETADHTAETWQPELFHEKAILCGVCKHELTIHEYLNSSNECPVCQASFNPGCKLHHHLYFSV